jgi:hypothetical protein
MMLIATWTSSYPVPFDSSIRSRHRVQLHISIKDGDLSNWTCLLHYTYTERIRLVALGTAPGAARRAPVRNRAPRARTGVLQYSRYVQFQAWVPQMESSMGHALRPLLAPPRLAVVGPCQERKGERKYQGSRERKMAGHRTAPGRRGAGAAASRGRRERSRGRALGSATAPACEELLHLLRLRRSRGRCRGQP